MKQTYSKNYLQKLMMKKTHSDDEFLGADTEISPHVIDFLNTPSSASKIKVKQPHSRRCNRIKLDEYEQAMLT